jgi:hypothetical protein
MLVLGGCSERSLSNRDRPRLSMNWKVNVLAPGQRGPGRTRVSGLPSSASACASSSAQSVEERRNVDPSVSLIEDGDVYGDVRAKHFPLGAIIHGPASELEGIIARHQRIT